MQTVNTQQVIEAIVKHKHGKLATSRRIEEIERGEGMLDEAFHKFLNRHIRRFLMVDLPGHGNYKRDSITDKEWLLTPAKPEAAKPVKTAKRTNKRNALPVKSKIKAPRKAKAAPAPAKPVKQPTVKSVSAKQGIGAFMRAKIEEGLTNEEVYLTAIEHFGSDRIGPSHRRHPAWYRCKMKQFTNK